MLEKVLTVKDLEDLQNDPKALEFWKELVEKGEKIVVSLPNVEKPAVQPRSNCPWWGFIWCK